MTGFRHLLHTATGLVGQVTSICLFGAPIATMLQIYKKKDVEEFSPNPYMAGVMNCLMWVFYGLPFVSPNNILVITTNGLGLALEMIYVGIYLYYAKKNQRKYVLIVIATMVGAFSLIVGLILGFTHDKGRLFVTGCVTTIFCITLYGMPLDIIVKVIKTKSAEYLPPWLCLANLLNGFVWALYAIVLRIDLYILVSNGTGALLGVLQLILWAIYRKRTLKDSDHFEKPTAKDGDGHDKPKQQIQLMNKHAAMV